MNSDRLRHVYWIGGGSGAGKSTAARTLAAKHGFGLYDTDVTMANHGRRASAETSPFLHRFASMDIDERWLNRAPQEMLETFHWFRGEAFNLVVHDLVEESSDRPLIAEGLRLLPGLVKPLLHTPARAVWLLPTQEFRRAAFENRRPDGAPWTFIDQTRDRERALNNLLERDRMFTDRLRQETLDLELRTVDVDVGMSPEEVAGLASAALDL